MSAQILRIFFSKLGWSPLGERQSIAQKGVRAIDARNSWLENGSDTSKTSVLHRANGPGGFGSQTAADPPWQLPTTPEKQTAGTVTGSHRGCLGRGKAFG